MRDLPKLSDQLRPGVDAESWVIEEVKKLEALATMMREVVAVAVTMLHDSHRDEVARTFTTEELVAIVKITQPLFVKKVEDIYRAAWDASNGSPPCWCATCRPITMSDMRMVTCPDCGNKRCPRATDHRNACTNSNEPGQPGSAYSIREYPKNPNASDFYPTPSGVLEAMQRNSRLHRAGQNTEPPTVTVIAPSDAQILDAMAAKKRAVVLDGHKQRFLDAFKGIKGHHVIAVINYAVVGCQWRHCSKGLIAGQYARAMMGERISLVLRTSETMRRLDLESARRACIERDAGNHLWVEHYNPLPEDSEPGKTT